MEKTKKKQIGTIVLTAVTVLLCVLVFVIFGQRDSSGEQGRQYTLPPVTAEPNGVPLEAFVSSLESCGAFTVSGPVDRHAETLSYELGCSDGRSVPVYIATDAMGRVTSARLELAYPFVDTTDATVADRKSNV